MHLTNAIGYADGTGTAAQFGSNVTIGSIAVDTAGNVYVSDTRRIRKITPAGVVTTLAGSGNREYADGTGDAASFYDYGYITIDSAGNIYMADTNRIRKITPEGVVTTLAGSSFGYVDGTGSQARFGNMAGIAVDGSRNLYVVDIDGRGPNFYRIRKITQ